MNILQLAKLFNHGGVATHITELSEELIKNNIVIVASSYGTHIENLKSKCIKHYELNYSLTNPLKIFASVYKLYQIIKKEEIQIVHCHNRSCAIYMMFISKLTKIPYIWSIHQEKIPSNFIYRNLTFYGEKAIGTTRALQEFLINDLKIPSEKTAIIYYGINIENLIKAPEEKILQLKKKFEINNEKVITLLGRLEEIKGHKCLVKAIAKLGKKANEVKVLFVGDVHVGYKNELDQLMDFFKIKNQFVYTNYITAQDVLSISDLMVLPSYKDGITLAVLNAFAMNVPVIRTKTSGYNEVKDYCIGMDFDDSDFLANEIIQFLEGKDYSNMINNAHNFVLSECSISSMAAKLCNIYEECLQN